MCKTKRENEISQVWWWKLAKWGATRDVWEFLGKRLVCFLLMSDGREAPVALLSSLEVSHLSKEQERWMIWALEWCVGSGKSQRLCINHWRCGSSFEDLRIVLQKRSLWDWCQYTLQEISWECCSSGKPDCVTSECTNRHLCIYVFVYQCSSCYYSEAGKDPLRKAGGWVEKKLKEKSFRFLLLKAYLGLGFFSFLKLIDLLLPPAWHKAVLLSLSGTSDCLCAHTILPKLCLALQEISSSRIFGEAGVWLALLLTCLLLS